MQSHMLLFHLALTERRIRREARRALRSDFRATIERSAPPHASQQSQTWARPLSRAIAKPLYAAILATLSVFSIGGDL